MRNYDAYGKNTGSGIGKWAILALILGGLYVLGSDSDLLSLPRSSSPLSTSLTQSAIPLNPTAQNFSRGINLTVMDADNDTITDTNDICPDSQNSSVNLEGCTELQVFERLPVNACGSKYYGLPDYEGTDKKGMTCMDFPMNERDLECVANPPTNYDGSIYGTDSNPLLYCCWASGECTW